MGMRWTKKDEKTLKKSVNNYNNKVNRLKDKGVDKRVIPEKLSYKKLRREIEDRTIFKDQLSINKAFTKRGSEQIALKRENGIVVTKYREYEIKKKIARINKERAKLKKYYENFSPTDRGQIQEGKLSEYAVGTNNLTPIKFHPETMYNFNMDLYIKGLDEFYDTQEKMNRIYVENFKNSIQKNYSEEHAQKFDKLFKEIPDQLIVDNYYTDESLHIQMNYEVLKMANVEDGIEDLYLGWRRIRNNHLGIEEDDDTMLDHFYGRVQEEPEEKQ